LWRISVPIKNYEIKSDANDSQIKIDDVVFHLRWEDVVGTINIEGSREEAIKKA
jgi:hypothetical protein